jgi:hypothetical protein
MALMAIFKMLLGVEHGIEEAVFII